MDFTAVLIFIIISAIVALTAFLFFRRRPESGGPEDAAGLYAEGLNLLLAGDKAAALEKLRAAVSKDSDNVDAYLKIGDILRESGQVEKAINVHKYLTVRRGLSSKQQSDILHSLSQDYLAAHELDRALRVINGLLSRDKKVLWAKEMKVQIFEQKQEWDRAFQAYRELLKGQTGVANGRLALYKVQEGLQLLDDGNEKEAQNRFKEAIKIDPRSPSGYLNLARCYRRENRKSDALKVLKEFVEKVPEESHLAFGHIRELLYEGGVYGEIENLYLDIVRKQPDNLTVRLALAEIYEKKGELQKALKTCSEVLERDPANKRARKNLVKLYHKSGDNERAIREAIDLIDQSLEQKEQFKCRHCGYEAEEPFWRCPECHEWEPIVKN